MLWMRKRTVVAAAVAIFLLILHPCQASALQDNAHPHNSEADRPALMATGQDGAGLKLGEARQLRYSHAMGSEDGGDGKSKSNGKKGDHKASKSDSSSHKMSGKKGMTSKSNGKKSMSSKSSGKKGRKSDKHGKKGMKSTKPHTTQPPTVSYTSPPTKRPDPAPMQPYTPSPIEPPAPSPIVPPTPSPKQTSPPITCVEIGTPCSDDTTCCGGTCRVQAPLSCESLFCDEAIMVCAECFKPDICQNSACAPGNDCCVNDANPDLQDFCIQDEDCCGEESFCNLNFNSNRCCSGGGTGCNFANDCLPFCDNSLDLQVGVRRGRRSPLQVFSCDDAEILRNCFMIDLFRQIPVRQVCQLECDYCS